MDLFESAYQEGMKFAKSNGNLNDYATLYNKMKSQVRGMIPYSYFEYEYQDMIKKDKGKTHSETED